MEEYFEIFSEVLEIEDRDKLKEANIEDTAEWDSYAHMELIVRLEEGFSIVLNDEDLMKFTSFKEGLNILKSKGINLEE